MPPASSLPSLPSRLRALLAVLLAACVAGCGDDARADGAAAARQLEREAERLYERGEHDASAAYYARAAESAAAAGEHDLALGYRAQSAVCLKMAGRTGEARELLLPVLAEARRRPELGHTLGLALGNLARVEALEGHFDVALQYLDELAELARAHDDAELEVKTLEQAAVTAQQLGRSDGALARLERALERDATLPEEARRRDALLRQLASARAAAGDDEGALALWLSVEPSAAGMANEARHLVALGLHDRAAALARQAARGFDAEGPERRDERDRALLVELSALLAAGELTACDELLAQIVQPANDPLAQAPFRVLRARVALARNEPEAALDDLRAVLDLARGEVGPVADAPIAGWLAAVAHVLARRPQDALVQLESVAPSGARALLAAWATTRLPDEPAAVAARLDGLEPDPSQPVDATVATLRELCPAPLPSWAHVALEVFLHDAQVARDAGDDARAQALVRAGARAALLWQAMEAVARVAPGATAGAEHLARVDGWVAGELPDDAAVIAVVPGDAVSYLLLCTSELGATTFGLPPRLAFATRVGAVVDALRTADTADVAAAGRSLFELLFPAGALDDLDGRRRWTVIPSDDLAAAPPALWVAAEPGAAGGAAGVPWLVREHFVTLLPHALAGGPVGPAPDWVQLDAPALSLERLPIAGAELLETYGRSAFDTEPGGVDERARRFTGAQATAGVLRAELGGVDGLLLDVPGMGGGRLAGFVLAPMLDADGAIGTAVPFHDEAAGLLPWHRVAELTLPAAVVAPRTRFQPGDVVHGPCHAATALLRSADQVVLTRWPMPPVPRAMIQSALVQQLRDGVPAGDALTFAQRMYLTHVETETSADARAAHGHPRQWAGWLAFGAP